LGGDGIVSPKWGIEKSAELIKKSAGCEERRMSQKKTGKTVGENGGEGMRREEEEQNGRGGGKKCIISAGIVAKTKSSIWVFLWGSSQLHLHTFFRGNSHPSPRHRPVN
jgi:hypothetical protein